jgi:glycerate dehydrogenase
MIGRLSLLASPRLPDVPHPAQLLEAEEVTIMSRRIVLLDGATLNPGDIDWECFEKLGDFKVYDNTEPEKILERSEAVPYLLVNKVPLTAQTIAQLHDLEYIGVTATGYNVVDIDAAAKRKIPVTNIPTYGTNTVAQHAAALMLEMARRITVHHAAVQDGVWSSGSEWCFALTPIYELTGRTLGIVGVGRIGLAVAKIAAAMGMKLVGSDAYWPDEQKLAGLEIERLEVDELFARADVITLHCPLSDETHHLVNARRLALMKRTAAILNTSRGPLVDEQALADALTEGRIAGAGLDVLEAEPPAADNPLFKAPNCVITPHIAWYAAEARSRLLQVAAENLKAFIQGKPTNVVNQ